MLPIVSAALVSVKSGTHGYRMIAVVIITDDKYPRLAQAGMSSVSLFAAAATYCIGQGR